MRNRMTMRLMVVYLSFILLGMLISISFPMIYATGQYQTHTMLPMQGVDTFREPFKDFFDYEWWLQGSEYDGKRLQYGKWFVIETFYDAGVPRQLFYITKENPITGTDSAQIKLDGSKTDMTCYAWRGLTESPDPDHTTFPNLLNPAYLRFRFRIDEWVTYRSEWKVTLAAIGGTKFGVYPEPNSWAEGQVIIGLQANPNANYNNPDTWSLPPRLRLHYRIGDSFDYWTDEFTQKVLSEEEVSIGDVHTLEIMRSAGSVDGMVAVWFDGVQVPDLTFEGLDTSYPGGMRTAFLGSNDAAECGFFSEGQSEGSRCTISFDDYIVRDEYIGADLLSIPHYDLTLDSSTQGKTVRVGNHILPEVTPTTIQVPEGTIPKVGIDPTNFDHWEIVGSPDYSEEIKNLFKNYSELWPDMSPSLMSTVTRAPPMGGPSPTPAIYQDTRITAMYTGDVKHTLNVTSDQVATSFTVDELDYITPWSDQLTEGTHTISMPSNFTVTVENKRYDFREWEDHSTNPTRTVNLVSDMNITACYDVTIIPEFPTLITWLAIIGVATLVIVFAATKMRGHSRPHRHFHSE